MWGNRKLLVVNVKMGKCLQGWPIGLGSGLIIREVSSRQVRFLYLGLIPKQKPVTLFNVTDFAVRSVIMELTISTAAYTGQQFRTCITLIHPRHLTIVVIAVVAFLFIDLNPIEHHSQDFNFRLSQDFLGIFH